MQLLGGRTYRTNCSATPVVAGPMWTGLAAQLQGYVDKGFKGVKMRVGVMDGDVRRKRGAGACGSRALGPDIKLMADAHGTFSVPEAKQFCAGVEECEFVLV